MLELGPRSENRPVDVNGEVYEKIRVQRDTALDCDLVDVTLYKVCHESKYFLFHPNYKLIQADGNLEPKSFHHTKVKIKHAWLDCH